ncbi:MAG: hypothetical protein E7295_04200 [Lachnospiraceae bacterium]|jgi:hypothetical protein|nr:hypothetical protein [Lachnospiraceae bacterium]
MDGLFRKITEECRKTGFLETVLEKAHYAPEDRELLWSVLEQVLQCMEGEACWSARAIGDKEPDGREKAIGNKEPDGNGKTIGDREPDGREKAIGDREPDGREKAIGAKELGAGKASCDEKEVGAENTDWSVMENADGNTDLSVKTVGTGDAGVRAVVMTLGAGVDQLQEDMLAAGKLTEAYMVEVLGSEILLLAYSALNAWVKEHTDFVVKRYYFLGVGEYVTIYEADQDGMGGGHEAEDHKTARTHTETAARISLELATLPDMLERSGLPVTCTEGYCMMPKKSVAFYAELTKDRTVTCEGICMGCGRKDCPNRMDALERTRGNRTLDRPLTYGYARILGLRES